MRRLLNDEQLKWLAEKYETTPIEELMEHLNLTKRQVWSVAWSILKVKRKRSLSKTILTAEDIEWLKANYAVTINAECRSHLGISERVLTRYAKELGLKKDEEVMKERSRKVLRSIIRKKGINPKHLEKYQFRKGVDPRSRWSAEVEAKRVGNATKTIRKMFNDERRRILFGLPQRTNWKLGHNRTRKYQECYLRKRGYTLDTENRIAYYTSETKRCPKIESHPIGHIYRFYTFKSREI